MPQTDTSDLYFEDLAKGQVFSAGPIQVSAARIKSFAEEFDPQSQHTDEESARESVFGQLVASGWHTGSIGMRMMYESFIRRLPNGGMGLGVEKMRWPAPVLPGDVLTGELTLDEARASGSKPNFGVVTMTLRMVNQKNEPVLQMTSSALVGRRTTP